MTLTTTGRGPSTGLDIATSVTLVAAGLGCLLLLGLSDVRGSLSFPPDDSLFSAQNGMQAIAIMIGGVLIAIPRLSDRAKQAVGGVVAVSAALLLGTALWAMKHWASYAGTSGLPRRRTDAMEPLSAMIAVAALIATVLTVVWLLRARPSPSWEATGIGSSAIWIGIVTIVALPLFLGVAVDDMALTMLGTFALRLAVPWGLAFILSAYVTRPAAVGVLGAVGISTALWVVEGIRYSEVLIAIGLGVVLLACAWLLTMLGRDGLARRVTESDAAAPPSAGHGAGPRHQRAP